MVVSAQREHRSDARTAAQAALEDALVWHDLECGRYAVDLPLWRELAAAAGTTGSAAVLEIGAGSGRVALELAHRGHRVCAVDLDDRLLGALRERAAAAALAIETVCADARTLALARADFALCIVAMQTLQLLGGADGRRAFLERARAHLAPGGVLACAIVTELEPFDGAAGEPAPSPEVARVGPLRYVSRPTRVLVEPRLVRIERERSVTAGAPASEDPGGETACARDVVELDRVSVAQLRREARGAGLSPAGTRAIPETDEYTGAVAVLFHA